MNGQLFGALLVLIGCAAVMAPLVGLTVMFEIQAWWRRRCR